MARAARRERSRAEQRLSIGRFAKKFVTWQGGGSFFSLAPRFCFLHPTGRVPLSTKPYFPAGMHARVARYDRAKFLETCQGFS